MNSDQPTVSKVKTFQVHLANEIPPFSNESVFQQADTSDYFLAKLKYQTLGIKVGLIRYCFRRKRWLNAISGSYEVLEYYSELPEKEVDNG